MQGVRGLTDATALRLRLETARSVAAGLRSALADLERVGILGDGTYGVKLRSRLELASARLSDCATAYEAQLRRLAKRGGDA